MKALLAPLKEIGEYEKIQSLLKKGKEAVLLTGCVDSQKLHMIYGFNDGFDVKIIVTFSDLKARELMEDARLYDRNVYYYPAKDLIFYQADIHGNQLVKERIQVLRHVLGSEQVTIVTTFSALMASQIPLDVWKKHIIDISVGAIP